MRKVVAFTLLFITIILTDAQVQNNDFEKLNNDSITNWHFKKLEFYEVKIDDKESHSKKKSLLIVGENEGTKSFQPFSQKVSFNTNEIKKIEISAFVKSENVNGKIKLWTQVRDTKDNMIAFANSETQKKIIPINKDWSKYSLEFIIDEDAKSLVIGGLFSGKGNVWFDDFAIKDLKFSDKEPSPIARDYIDDFKNIVQKNSIFSEKIDWEKLNSNLNILSKGIETIEDTDIALNYIINNLKKVGDKHSFIESKESFENRKISNPKGLNPEFKLIDGNIGYINVPGFNSSNKEIANEFAVKIQNMIKKLDDENNIKGWIVDLRNNTGGTMYPMIAGLGSLIGDGILGYFVARDKKTAWNVANGKVGQFSIQPKVKNFENKIAVLIGKKTASAGEATAISFIGKSNVKLFGQPSGGFTSANKSFRLSDGKSIALAVSFEMDRTGKEYREKIYPDVLVESSKEKDADTEAAKIWIQE